jgi:flagellar motor switch protein FliG
MGVLTRYKKDPDGFRKFVELLETTPSARRQKMIDVSMAEDPEYTESAMKLMFVFQDVLGLPDLELAEVCATAQPRTIAMAISQLNPEVRDRFIKCSKPPVAVEVRDYLSANNAAALRDVGGAQLKMIEVTRSLEKRGLIKTKRIPA